MIFAKSKQLLIPRFLFNRPYSSLNLWGEELSHDIKHKIEKHWRDKLIKKRFAENGEYKDKFYVVPMFPYPSGNLHMGHVRVYTISDAVARFQRMNGKNVIHPIGWDAFGLPAENAAIDRQISPVDWTKTNITQMKSQLETLGCDFDWDREITTSDPDYYKWTQYLFLKLYENGLVYQKNAMVNWDPVDKTVLADEQVNENGCSWRSKAKVEIKILRQWFVRTTRFAKDLLEGLDNPILEDWRDITKLQKHWIGDCDGVNLDFKLVNSNDFITLWTPYPEYINDAKFVTVSHKHSIASQYKGNNSHSGTIKLDIELENPFTSEKIPIFVSDEINYLNFTDSFVGIPTVCEKARDFAEEHKICFSAIKKLNDVDVSKAQDLICNLARNKGIGGYWTSAKLRDWLISRQRYWGTPIPIIHCDNCGVQAVPMEELPVKLPLLPFQIKRGGLHLAECEEWVNTKCPKCKSNARRETDTMDTFVDSSWYYLRYLDPRNDKQIFDVEKVRKTSPVDLYIGGKEHAVLHLYYARFMSYFLHSLGMLPEKEPFKRLLVQGMVMGRSFRLKGTGKYLPPNEVDIVDLKRNKAVEKKTGEPVVVAWEKMGKSKLNGVEPTDMFREYGVDTIRLLILGDVAPTSHRNWNSNTFPGILNWQKRLWLTIRNFLEYRNKIPAPISEEDFKKHEDFMFDARNYYIKGTTFNYYISQQLSVALSKQQGLTNDIRKMPPFIFAKSLQFERALAAQTILLAPMAPHFASELWSGLQQAPHRLNTSGEIMWDKSVLEQKWPVTDYNYRLELVCQINGTDRCAIKLERFKLDEITLEEALDLARNEETMKDIFNQWNISDSVITVHKGIKAVLNLRCRPTVSVKNEKDQDLLKAR